MPIFRKEASVGALVVLAGFLSACASTTMQSMQRSPDFQTANLHKVLVVCLTSMPGMRDQLESEFARQWKERRVLAMPSSQVLPPDVTLDKAGIAPYAKAHGFDSVLVTRLLKREKIEPQIAQPKSQDMPPAPTDTTLTTDVQAIVASPEYSINYDVAVVSVTLYSTATEKRIWSGQSQTVVTGEVLKDARPFVKIILKNIYEPPKS